MNFFRPDLLWEYFPTIVKYLPTTLKIAALSAVFGIVLGLILMAARVYHIPVLEQIATVLISFLRATPPNILLLMIFFAIPFLLQDLFMRLFNFNINRMELINYVLVAYSVMNSAFFAEMFRASIQGVDKGQTEAAYAIGMTKAQAFFRIVFPQAFRIAVPEFGNILINILKNTSLAYMVGVVDLMGAVSLASISTFHPFEGYLIVAVIYFVLSVILEQLFRLISGRLNRYA